MGDQAVVLGASMAGMLAARVLADRYEQVTVVERDRLPTGAEHRRGVPQGRHFHTVLMRGAEILDTMFPGLGDALGDAGAYRPNLLLDARMVMSGHQLCRVDVGRTVQLTRPLLESRVRDRLTAIPNVRIVDGCAAVGPRVTGERVTGVHVAHHDGRSEELGAELVVDAMGRAGRTATWLRELGYDAPAEERITADITYVSRLVRIPEELRPADRMVLVGAMPGRPRGFILAAQEGDRWMFTTIGMAGQRAPTNEDGMVEFVASSAAPDIQKALDAAEPVGDVHRHRYPASVWRRYERLRRFPPGLLAFGDSICSFNPVYGQGMTVAALQANALGRCLRTGDHDLARRFYRAAARIVSPAWRLNAGGDLALPEVEGNRTLSVRAVNRYVARLQRIAEHDPAVSAAFIRVASLRAHPSAMMAPRILARALLPRRPRRRPVP
jgi:2-polyprenyl-6-methoxyphenol hydroxylase-like FAD-dependent oxidoreductase